MSIVLGSYGIYKMVIILVSMDMVVKIAYGFGGDLIFRSVFVMFKEKRFLFIVFREMFLSIIMLENLFKFVYFNVIIVLLVMIYYI